MKILIFILFKFAEIAVIVFVPYLSGCIFALIDPVFMKDYGLFGRWCWGLLFLLFCGAVIAGVILGGHILIKANWQWAGRIIK